MSDASELRSPSPKPGGGSRPSSRPPSPSGAKEAPPPVEETKDKKKDDKKEKKKKKKEASKEEPVPPEDPVPSAAAVPEQPAAGVELQDAVQLTRKKRDIDPDKVTDFQVNLEVPSQTDWSAIPVVFPSLLPA